MMNVNTPTGGAFTVVEFCRTHGISRGLFYRLIADGSGPRIMKLGKRTLVSSEAAADWRRAMEANHTGRAV